MLTSIYLQRRRILFGMFFFFSSGILDFGHFDGWNSPVYVIGMSVAFACICGALAALLIPVFPSYRQVFEIVAVTFVGLRLAEVLGITGEAYYALDGAVGLILICVGYTLLHHAIYGQWWSRSPFRLAWKGETQFVTRASPSEAWARFVPNPERPEDYYSGTLHAFQPVDEADYTHVFRTRMGGPQFLELRVNVEEDNKDKAFAYSFDADVSDRNRALSTGNWRLDLTDVGNGTRVRVVETVLATTPATAINMYFDDLASQVGVSMKRAIDGRKDPSILGWHRRQIQATA